MSPDMYPDQPLLQERLKTAHTLSWQKIAAPGPFWRGADRVGMVAKARAAHDCQLCRARKDALSPFAVEGDHQGPGHLEPLLVDLIHRISTDPQRLTRSLFDAVINGGISQPAYVEVVSVVNSSVIIDTLHRALGLPLPELPEPLAGEPSGVLNADSVDEGAWVPILAAPRDMADTGLPAVPNIARAMGLVPDAVDLFFTTFRPHYALKDIPLSISQGQAEFVASRVSALNECFY